MKKVILVGWLGLILIFTAACSNGKPNQLHYQVTPFNFINQDEKTVALSDLKGKVWIADFVFTYCTTVCPTMTANMSKLQKQLKAAGVEAQIVSFSVDPERDKPEALKKYLSKFDADFSNWHALTGYEFDEIQTFALKSFKSIVTRDASSNQVIHGTLFYLVDSSGTVVAKYDGSMDTPYDKIIKDIKALQR
ncbi:SCO family protein [Paenibacillus sp. WQ 127069]|uniref:SCO family protein n=1 Tax=Paenibacillus baimaensis TaxID=2982185 RepID=A0ABT2UQS3_9BACL|nr:SCO family protein [Paenibacillus sp. WQ 127069]MCU6796994.1 SCO family protein [Paenibacillus sp. WQ 127069]